MRLLEKSNKSCTRGKISEKDVPDCLVAAGAGYPGSQTTLGLVYHSGSLLKQDYVKANEWFEKAAKQGNTKSQAMLSKDYQEGLGFQKDPIESYVWLYVVANTNPKNEIEEKIVNIVKPAVSAMESVMDEETLRLAQEKGREYFSLYGSH